MFNRGLFALFLAAAVGLPYLASSFSGVADLLNPRGAAESGGGEVNGAPGRSIPGRANLAAAAQASRGPNAASGVYPLEEVFRFDVTTAWVLSKWPRVSTGLANLDLQGYRVSLVSGTRPDDVAGSLTYYFNSQQRVQKITFQGTTGDSRRLVSLLAGQHGLVRQVTSDPGLFLYEAKRQGRPISQLRIKPSQVVRADVPHARFEVALVLDKPGR
jgi:hypothetical protein